MSNAIFPHNVKGFLRYRLLKSMEFASIVQTSPNLYSTRIAKSTNPIWHFTLLYDYLYDTYRSPNNTQAYAPYTDFQTLLAFLLARRGRQDDFLFSDPDDYSAAGLRGGVWQAAHPYTLGTVVIDFKGHAQLVTTAGTSGARLPAFSSAGGTTPDGSDTLVWTDQGYYPKGWPNARVTLQVLQDEEGLYYSPLQRSVGGLFLEDVTDLNGPLSVYANGVAQVALDYSLEGPGLALPGASFMGLYLKWTHAPATPVTANFNFYHRVHLEEDTQDFETWAQGLWAIGGDNGQAGSGTLKLCSSRTPSV